MRYFPIAERRTNPPDQASLQATIDSLCRSIDRPTLLDDPDLAPLAYSRQWGQLDPVRTQSILGRSAPAEVRESLLAQGIGERLEVFETEPVPELGMEARICRTLRSGDEVLGYLWLIPGGTELSNSEYDKVEAAARTLERSLSANDLGGGKDETGLLEVLLGKDSPEQVTAIGELVARGIGAQSRIVLCLIAVAPGGASADEVATTAARNLTGDLSIAGRAPEGGALVISLSDPAVSSVPEHSLAQWLHAFTGSDSWVGQSGVATIGHLPMAHHHASVALSIARSERGDSAVAWERLGAYRLIGQLPQHALHDLPQGLSRLIDQEPDLARTLEIFLDCAGNVKAASAQLSLHRSGLYYRLTRIEQMTGLDLSSGDDRLLAHLALRTGHLF